MRPIGVGFLLVLFQLMTHNIVQAQLNYEIPKRLVAWAEDKQSSWEFSIGTGLMNQNQRPVYTLLEVPTGAPNGTFSTRRDLKMRTHFLFDFDLEHREERLPKWSLLYGLGAGIMQYEVFWQDYRYNAWRGAYIPISDLSNEIHYNYTSRLLLGARFNQALSRKHSLTLVAYAGYQINGWEKDFRVEDDYWIQLPSFPGPFLFGRRFVGFETGINTLLSKPKSLQTSLNISYRYIHFNSGRDYVVTHVLPGIHQIVFGWSFQGNQKEMSLAP